MNSHAHIQKRLSAYCEAELDLSERKMVEAHLSACPICRADLADMKTTLSLIHTTPKIEPPPWLTSRIMAHLREEQCTKRSWLQRICFPQQTGFPIKILALLVVCVSGYYLSRSVETDMKLATQQQLQEMPNQHVPTTPVPIQEPSKHKSQEAPASHTQPANIPTVAAPAAPLRQENMAIQSPQQITTTSAPETYVPAPHSLYKDQPAVKTEAKKVAPSTELYNRAQEAAPEIKAKNSRIERMNDVAAARSAGAPAGMPPPQNTIRLSINDPISAPNLIREAVSRCGGNITEDKGSSDHRLKIQISADRQQELLERLQLLGKLVERPAAAVAGKRLLELTIQW